MIAPVDVLETIRQACDRDALPYAVHAAVAELIEAIEAYDIPMHPTLPRVRRLRAALNRIHGVAP